MRLLRIIRGKLSRLKYWVLGIKYFIRDSRIYDRQYVDGDRLFRRNWKNDFPILMDRFDNAGTVDGHYFIQDLIMAKAIIKSKIKNHYDIGSRVDGFIAHLLAAALDVTLIDIRPFPISVDNLHFIKGNATELENISDNTIQSLSCLHALEHFGLGRYGDPVDKDAWKKALYQYERILSKGGILYLSVPIGPEDKLMFNAHRIFHPATIVNAVTNLKLIWFAYIKTYEVIIPVDVENYTDNGDYLCGLFIFEKE